MNLTYFTVPSFKKKQIVTTEGNKGHEYQPFVAFVSFCSKSLFLAGALLFLGRATSVQAQFTYITNNGAITITGYTGSGGVVTIPNTITGMPVISIAAGALNGTPLTSVTIPANVTNIGHGAFQNCSILLAINVDPGNQSYTGLNGVLFNASQNLLIQFPNGVSGGYTIPDSVTLVGSEAFWGCWRLTSVAIPNSVTNIGDYAFYNCFNLTNITIGTNVASIGNYAFSGDVPGPSDGITPGGHPQGCGLTSVTIPNSVTNIGESAFYSCVNLTNVTLVNGVTSIGDSAFAGTRLTSVTIPNSVTNIGESAFYSCVNLTNVTMGNGVTSIGDSVFAGTSLTSITIPNSVTSIAESAFAGLTAINVAPGNPAYSSLAGVLFNQSQTTLIEFPSRYSAAAYSIPAGVTDIESNAFSGSDLTSITIPDSLTSIEAGAFQGCYALTAINVAPGNPAYSSVAGVLFNKSHTTLLEYPAGLGGSYAIPNSVTTIAPNAFNGCWTLTSVTIPSSLSSIGEYAFAFSGLTSARLPDSVMSIGDYAFYDCTSLTNVVLDNNLISIGAYAFSGPFIWGIPPDGLNRYFPCPLTSITIPDSVTSIGDSAFQACPLTNVTIGDSVTSIGEGAFSQCNLTTVTIPNSVTSIGDGAFQFCHMTNAYFLGNAPGADSTVFSGDSLTAYYLPGTTGWAEFTTNTGVPTALWTLPYPLVLNGSSGVQSNQFGFTISWATNVPVVVEASTDLSNPVWTPVATNTLSNGTSSFSDPDWTNYPNRFYRLRSQ